MHFLSLNSKLMMYIYRGDYLITLADFFFDTYFIRYFCLPCLFFAWGQKCKMSTCRKMEEKKKDDVHLVSSDQPAKCGEFCNMIRTKWGSNAQRNHSSLQFQLGLWRWRFLVLLPDSIPNNNNINKTKKSQGQMPWIWINSLFGMFFLVTQKTGQNRMDEADKKKHLTNHSELFHIFTRREESQCGGLRSTCSKFRMTVVKTIRSHVKTLFQS